MRPFSSGSGEVSDRIGDPWIYVTCDELTKTVTFANDRRTMMTNRMWFATLLLLLAAFAANAATRTVLMEGFANTG